MKVKLHDISNIYSYSEYSNHASDVKAIYMHSEGKKKLV